VDWSYQSPPALLGQGSARETMGGARPANETKVSLHEGSIRGRVELSGNAPESGFLAFRVGTKG